MGLLWGHFGVILASLLVYQGDFETLWGYFGVTLGSCVGMAGPNNGHDTKNNGFRMTFEGSKDGVRRMSASSPAVCAHFEVTLGSLLVSEGGFGPL